ncbi:protein BTG4 [Lampris incognitus]|uniref:protein BTG4 n=1 Tax=Lampris incognitus TaxID=2546036 RepID=UPI0024B60397|nr:protein BTG4 [Lampris incognitus]
MREEIAATVFFVARLTKRYGCLDNDSRDRFAGALTSTLFESYKNHWDPLTPSKGQAYRCLRMNRVQLRDPVLEEACVKSAVRYEDLGLPRELTVWVDPGEVSCRYGEHSAPFCVSIVDSDSCRRRDREFSRRIQDAVERASTDIQSGASSDDDEDTSVSSSGSSLPAPCPAPAPVPNPEPKTIPTVSNPNSVYQFSDFSPCAPQIWVTYQNRKPFVGDGLPSHAPPPAGHSTQFSGSKAFKPYRPAFSFTGPRVDKYHWVSKTRS